MIQVKLPHGWIVGKTDEVTEWLAENVAEDDWNFTGVIEGVFHFAREEHAVLFRLRFGV